MNTVVKFFATCIFSLSAITAFAQNQEQEEQKSPIEMAAIQADKLQKEFKLTDSQTFLVDSILQANFQGVFDEFEKMKKGGVQSSENYKAVQDKWLMKTEKAFRIIFNDEQFLKYQKMTGSYAKNKKAEKDKLKAEAKLNKIK